MDEQMVPGDYTALIDLKIRSQMETQSVINQVGVYSRGVPFTVYEVYAEHNGIVWGRVSSNTGTGSSRFVGLRVANQAKAKLEKAFAVEPENNPVVQALDRLTDVVRSLKA